MASAPSHWPRRLSVSSAWSNARALGAGPSADAAVSRCCRDAAAGAAALTLRASSSERHRGGAGGDAAGTERREAADTAGLVSVTCWKPGGLETLIPTLQLLAPPEPGMGGGAAAETGGGREPIGGGERVGGGGGCRKDGFGGGGAEQRGWLGDSEEAKPLGEIGGLPVEGALALSWGEWRGGTEGR